MSQCLACPQASSATDVLLIYTANFPKIKHEYGSFFLTFVPRILLLPTDAQENRFQRSIKIYIKIKIAPTCVGVVTIIRERTV